MPTQSISDAIYRLGKLSQDEEAPNSCLLTKLAEITAQTVGAEIVTLAVFESGLCAGSNACVIQGPWTDHRPTEFDGDIIWAFEDRSLVEKLGGLRRGRVYHRPEFVKDLNGHSERLIASLDRCVASDDQAIALFQREDGAELLLAIHSPSGQGDLSRQELQRAGALAPFIARCWAQGWRHEPRWMHELSGSSRDVLRHVLEGLDDDQIADRTGLSYHSVRAHLKRMFKAADVRSRLHLMQKARGIFQESDEEGAEAVSPIEESADRPGVSVGSGA